MAAVRGELSQLKISNLVQALVLDRSTGVLTLESGSDQRILRISPAGIRLLRGSKRCHRLARLLPRLDRSTSDDTGSPGNLLSQDAATHLVQEWMFEEICELFTWTRGTFTYRKVDPSEIPETGPFAAYAVDCEIPRVILEVARWTDEFPRVIAAIHDVRRIPLRTEIPVPSGRFGLDGQAVDDILRLIDGCRPVVHIVQSSVFPRFMVLEILFRMMSAGVIRMNATPAASSAA
jgi:hypothetical protein